MGLELLEIEGEIMVKTRGERPKRPYKQS